MGMQLDNVLQLTFGLLALLTAVLGIYISWKLTSGTSSMVLHVLNEASLLLIPTGRHRRRRNLQHISRSIPSYGVNMPATSDQRYYRRAFLMEDVVWVGCLEDDINAS